jgi:hypothetical protein
VISLARNIGLKWFSIMPHIDKKITLKNDVLHVHVKAEKQTFTMSRVSRDCFGLPIIRILISDIRRR